MAKESQDVQADARRDFWLQQYATAFTNRDKRGAAVALKFVQQYNHTAIRAQPKEQQQS